MSPNSFYSIIFMSQKREGEELGGKKRFWS